MTRPTEPSGTGSPLSSTMASSTPADGPSRRSWPPRRRTTSASCRCRARTRSTCIARRRGHRSGREPRPPWTPSSSPRPFRRRAVRRGRPAPSSWLGQHERPLGRHTLANRHPLTRHDPDGVVGPPWCGGDDGRDGVGDLVPRPRHVRHVRERQRREPAVARTAQHVGAPRHRGQVGMVEERTLGLARGPAGPDDAPPGRAERDRASCPAGRPARTTGPGRARPRRGGTVAGTGDTSGSTTRSTGAVRSMMESTSPAPIRGLIPEVIAPRRSSAA